MRLIPNEYMSCLCSYWMLTKNQYTITNQEEYQQSHLHWRQWLQALRSRRSNAKELNLNLFFQFLLKGKIFYNCLTIFYSGLLLNTGHTVKHPRPIIHATLQPGSADVFVPSCDDDIIRLFDLRQSVTGMILLTDYNFLLSHTFCSWFSTLVVITFFPVLVLRGHRSSVYAVQFNPYNYVLAFAGAEKTINLWTPVAQQ